LDTLVVYDVPKEKLRRKVYEACKDHGLKRFQYSAFRGPLDRNRRQEMYVRLLGIVGKHTARILVLALCAKDSRAVLEHVAYNPEDEEPQEAIPLDRPAHAPQAVLEECTEWSPS
jgi:CRISPR-associated protein Cas2